jgi:RNA-binding protein
MEVSTNAQKKRLKSLAHSLKPVVMIGQQGLKETIQAEIDTALSFHQLIKLKVAVGDRDVRNEMINTIAKNNQAELIQRIGNIAVLYKRNKKKSSLL